MDKLYPTQAKNVERWSWAAGMFGSNEMTFGTANHNLHRMRRGAISSFFSKASVRKLQPVIRGLVEKLCNKLERTINTGQPVNMVYAYSALTQDIITGYSYSDCSNVLEMDNFSPKSYDFLQRPAEIVHSIMQFPLMLPILKLFPDWWVRLTNPLFAEIAAIQKKFDRRVESIFSEKRSLGSNSHSTIIHSLRDSPDLPASEKTLSRVSADAQSLVGAGTLTTAHMLSITSYHILANPSILGRLRTELEPAIPNTASDPSLQSLEQLPYLTALLNEGLRVSYGTIYRLTRVHPDRALNFNEWTIPPGTPVGMSSVFMHDDPRVFPNPRQFDPERWLGPEKEARLKFLFIFGRGQRMCLGKELALAEMYMALAMVFGRLGGKMRLFDTERDRDVDIKHDFFVTNPSFESRGIWVLFGDGGDVE